MAQELRPLQPMPQTSPSEPRIDILPPEAEAYGPRLDQLRELSEWMDSKFQVPGTGWRFGLDALLGLIPGLGDTLTFFVSCYILSTASRFGVPRITLARMGLNVIIDFVVGCFPVLGDLFDVAWKANTRNVELLRRTLESAPDAQRRARRGDWLFVAGLLAGLLAMLVAIIAAAWLVIGGIAAGLDAAIESR
jgi:hypothetical protein